MAANNKNSFDYTKMPSSGYVKITLESILKSLHRDHEKNNPELIKEVESLLNTFSSKQPYTMAELKASHSHFSPQLSHLIKQKIEYINAHKLQEVEPVATAIMALEKPASIAKPSTTPNPPAPG